MHKYNDVCFVVELNRQLMEMEIDVINQIVKANESFEMTEALEMNFISKKY